MNKVLINGFEIDLDDQGLVYMYQFGLLDYGRRKMFVQVYHMGFNKSMHFAGSVDGFEPEVWKELKERFPTAIEYSTWKMRDV